MSLINVLFGNRQNIGAEIGTFEMDVTLQENHELSSEVTENAVEDGFINSDHVIRNPKRVTIEGLVTSSPIRFLVPEFRTGFGLVTDAFDKLEELHDAGEPITLVTAYRVYENMIIERLTLPKTREVALRFTAELKQVSIVSTSFLAASENLAADVANRATSETDGGRQTARESSEATTQQGSLLNSAWNALTGG